VGLGPTGANGQQPHETHRAIAQSKPGVSLQRVQHTVLDLIGWCGTKVCLGVGWVGPEAANGRHSVPETLLCVMLMAPVKSGCKKQHHCRYKVVGVHDNSCKWL
jgi:hypothetical protein